MKQVRIFSALLFMVMTKFDSLLAAMIADELSIAELLINENYEFNWFKSVCFFLCVRLHFKFPTRIYSLTKLNKDLYNKLNFFIIPYIMYSGA